MYVCYTNERAPYILPVDAYSSVRDQRVFACVAQPIAEGEQCAEGQDVFPMQHGTDHSEIFDRNSNASDASERCQDEYPSEPSSPHSPITPTPPWEVTGLYDGQVKFPSPYSLTATSMQTVVKSA